MNGKNGLNKKTLSEVISPNKAFEGYCKQEQERSNDLENMLSLARCYHLGIGTIKNDHMALMKLYDCIPYVTFHYASPTAPHEEALVRKAVRQLMQDWQSAPETGEKLYCLGNALCLCNTPVYSPYFKDYFHDDTFGKTPEDILQAAKRYFQKASDMGYGEATFTLAAARMIEDFYAESNKTPSGFPGSDFPSGFFYEMPIEQIQKAAYQGSLRAKVLLADDCRYSDQAKAARLYQKVIDSHVRDFWGSYNAAMEGMGYLKLHQGKEREAMKFFMHLPNRTDNPITIADLFWKAGDLDTAFYYYKQVWDSAVSVYIDKYVVGRNVRGYRSLLEYVEDDVDAHDRDAELYWDTIRALKNDDTYNRRDFMPISYIEGYYLTPVCIQKMVTLQRKEIAEKEDDLIKRRAEIRKLRSAERIHSICKPGSFYAFYLLTILISFLGTLDQHPTPLYILYLVIIAMRCYYLGEKDGPGLLVFYYSFGWVIAFFFVPFSISFLICSILSFLTALIAFVIAGGDDWL